MSASAPPEVPVPRIGYYMQQFHKWVPDGEEQDEPLSLLPLADSSLHTTHIVLSAFHLNYDKDDGAGKKKIYLNEEIYDEGDNVRVWKDAEQVKAKGIKIIAGLGPDMWNGDHLGSKENFEMGYQITKQMIEDKAVDGVDLNIEPHDYPYPNDQMNADLAVTIIKRLRADFPSLLITLSPGGGELIGEGRLSLVNYRKLYKEVGHEIAWFHVQCYNNWGSLEDAKDFTKYVNAGYAQEQLVMMVPGYWRGLSGGWQPGDKLRQGIRKTMEKFPRMGGVACWEWSDAILEKPHPVQWAKFFDASVFPSSN